MDPLPATSSAMREEARRIGLMGPNQRTAVQTPRGQLFRWCYDSWKAGRSFSQSFIFLLGNTGVGKSSVVNHLLNVNIAAVSDSQSETRSTTEFTVSIDVPRLQVAGLSLGIVDTPGFNDTDGLAQDACNLLSIEKFWKNHPALDHGKFYPNAVLLCINSIDTRFEGKNSALSKTLRAVRDMHIVDKKKPNLIVVFTWACSLRGKGERWKNKLVEKGRKVNEILSDTLGVTAPVVLMENEFEEAELESVGDFTVLPDGTLQPKSLYVEMIDMMERNADSLGMVTVKEVFSLSSKDIPYNEGYSVAATSAESDVLNPKEQEIWNQLKQSQNAGVTLPEVTTKLNEYMEIKASELSEEDKNEVLAIGTDIVEGLGIRSIQEMNQYSIGMLNQALRKKLSAFGVKLVKEVFGVKEQSLSPEVLLNVGRGFNLISDELKPLAIFQLTDSRETEFGFSVPQGLTLTKAQQSQVFMEHFESEENYVKYRLQQLHVDMTVDTRVFSMKSKSGFSRSASTTSSVSQTERSFMLEYRLLQLQIEDFSKMKLTDSFKDHVEQRLPDVYDFKDAANRGAFEDFFNQYGQFVVTQAYGGGSVEAKLNSISTSGSQEEAFEIRMELESTFNKLYSGFSASTGTSYKDSDNVTSKARLTTSSLQWTGGDSQFHCMSLKDESSEIWKKWTMSLTSQPSLLTTEMSLTPMHVIVGMVNPKKMEACRQAVEDLFGGNFQAMAVKERKDRKALLAATTKFDTSNATEDPKSGGGCFPLDSLVQVRRRSHTLQVPLKDLQIGDEALTFSAKGVRNFSRVFMFNHRSDCSPVEFLHVITEADGDSVAGSIRLTGNHMIFVRVQGKVRTVFARDLHIGQELLVDDPRQEKFVAQRVTSIELVTGRGFCAPITMSGSIIVDNVWASCYANVPQLVGRIDAQTVAHGCMGAFRLAHRCGVARSALTISDGQEMPPAISWGVSRVLPLLLKLQ